MQDLPGHTFKILIRVFLQDLERFLQESSRSCKNYLVRSYKNVLIRFLQESYKICSKILPDSCQILDKILHDISSMMAISVFFFYWNTISSLISLTKANTKQLVNKEKYE